MYEIFAYQNADSLAGIFNGIVAVMGSGDFAGSIAAVCIFGFIVALIAYLYAPEKLDGWKWLGTVIVVYSIMYVPRVTVTITDKTSGNPASVVDNVPLGVAVLGSITSQVGNTLTSLFETAFQVIPGNGALPAELAYQQNGLMFGSRMVKYTRNVTFLSPTFRTDLIAFIDNCTKYDLLDGTLDPQAFSTNDSIWTLMSASNPGRLTPITLSPGTTTVTQCDIAYSILNAQALIEVGNINTRLAQTLNPTLTAAAASALFGNQVVAAYQKNRLASAAATATEIILQNAMINTVNDTSLILGQRTNDPASLLLGMGRAQATAQMNASWVNYGMIAEQALPLIRNVIEAICYALFPFVVLLLFLTSGRQTLLAVKSYALTLLWIQLWPPIWAVLNYIASIAASNQLSAAANVGDVNSLSLQTVSTIYSTSISLQAVVGYMCISVPAIAWAAIKGMETIGQAAITGVSSIQGTVGAASGQAALGNASMGNLAFEQQQLSANRTSAFMRSWQDDSTGNTFRRNAGTGTTAVDILANSSPFSLRTGASRNAGAEEQASRSVQAAREEMLAATQERQAVFAEALSHGRAQVDSSRFGSGYSKAQIGQFSDTYNEARNVVRQVASSININESDAAALVFQAQGGLSGGLSGRAGRSLSGGTGRGGGASDVASIAEGGQLGMQASVNGSLRQQYGAQVSREKGLSDTILSPEQAAIIHAFADNYSKDRNFVRAISTDDRDAQERSARLSNAVSRSERASAALTSAERFAEELRYSSSQSESFDADVLKDPRNSDMLLSIYRNYPSSPRMAAAAANSQLASMSGLTRPTSYGDGSTAAWGRSTVAAVHANNRTSLTLNPDVDKEFVDMKRQTGYRGSGPTPGAGDLRPEVEDKIHQARKSTTAAWNRNEWNRAGREATANEVIDPKVSESTPQNPDGTFGTGRILANDVANMFGQDVKKSAKRGLGAIQEDAKQLLNGWKK